MVAEEKRRFRKGVFKGIVLFAALMCTLLMLFAGAASAEETLDRYAVDGEPFVLMEKDGVRLYLTGAHVERDGRLYLEIAGENARSQAVSILFSSGEANGLSLAKNGDYLLWIGAYSFNAKEICLDADFIAAVNGVDVSSAETLTKFAGLETLTFELAVYDESRFVPRKLFDFGTGTIHFHAAAEQAADGATMEQLQVHAEEKAKEAIGADKIFVRREPLTLIDENGMKVYLTGEYYDYDALYLSARFENNTDMRLYMAYLREDDPYNHYTFGTGYPVEPGETEVGEIVLRAPFPEPDKVDLVFLAHDADDPKLETVFRMEAGVLYFGKEMYSSEGLEGAAVPEHVEEDYVEERYEYEQYQTLQNGSRGEAVVRLQKKLIELGHLSGKADGIYGKGTAAGVSRFQESVGLGETGVADPITQALLFGE